MSDLKESEFITKKKIAESFSVDDLTVYHWKYGLAKDTKGKYIKQLANIIFNSVYTLLTYPLLFYIIFWLLSLISEVFVFWCSVVIFFFLLSAYLFMKITLIGFRTILEDSDFASLLSKIYVRAYPALASIYLLIILSSPLFVPNQFINNNFNRFTWYLYYLEQVVSIFSFGIVDNFGLNFTNIQPIDTIGYIFTGILRTFITIGILERIYERAKTRLFRQEFIGTTWYFYHYYLFSLKKINNLEITVTGKVIAPESKIKMRGRDFEEVISEKSKRKNSNNINA